MRADWYLGSVSPFKVMHHATCRYARKAYPWARKLGGAEAIAKELWSSGAWRWHRACRFCAKDLTEAILDYGGPRI